MNDKLQQLYDLYKQKGIISTTDFNTFAAANDAQRQKLYDLGVQKGLFNTTDYNTFNTAWGGGKQEPLKKKEPTVSESKSGKPTSVSSSTGAKPVVKQAQGAEILTGFPGNEEKKYKFKDGKWYEESGLKVYGQKEGQYTQITTPSRIQNLNRYYKKDASVSQEEQVYSNYDDKKKDNLYRINNGQWERQVPGGKFTPVNDESATNALNRRYGQNVVYKPLAQKPAEKPKDFNNITASLVGQTEESGIDFLTKNYSKYGFTFEQEGAFAIDQIRVKTRDGKKEEVFEFDEKNPEEAARLRRFLQENASKAYSSTYNDLEGRVRSGMDKISPQGISAEDYLRFTQQIKDKNIKSEDFINDFKMMPVDEQKDFITNVLQKSGLSGKALQEFYKSEAYADYKRKKSALDQSSMDKLNQYYDELKYAEASKNAAKIKEAKAKINAYFTDEVIQDNVKQYDMRANDLSNSIKTLESDSKAYKEKVAKFNALASSGGMTQQQFDAQKAALDDEAENLQTRAQRIQTERTQVINSQNKLNYVAGKYIAAKEKEGNIGGFALNKIMSGVSMTFIEPFANYASYKNRYEDLTPEERKYYQDKGLSQEQVENYLDNQAVLKGKEDAKKAVIQTLGTEGTTLEYMNSSDRGWFTQAIGGVLESLPAMATGVAGSAASFTGLAAQAYSGIEEEMLRDKDFQYTSAADRALIAIPYAAAMGVLENIGLSNMIKADSYAGKVLMGVALKSAEKVGGKVTREALERVAQKEVESLIAKGAIKITQAGLAEFETGATQALVLDQGLKELYNRINQSGLTEEEKKNLTQGEFFDTADSLGELASKTFEDGLAEMVGGHVMGTVGVVAERLINGNISLYNEDDIKFLQSVASDSEFKKLMVANLKTNMLKGTMTKSQAESQLNALNQVEAVVSSIPSGISDKAKTQAFNLILERNKLQQEIDKTDPALATAQKERVNEINLELDKISKDAVQEQSTDAIPVQPKTGVGEEVEGGTPETGLKEVTEKATQEIDNYIADIGSEERIGSTLNPLMDKMANAEYINDNDIDNAINSIFSEVERIESSDQFSPETKAAMSDKLLNIADKLDNYEFRTKTENVEVTKAGAASPTRKTSAAVQKIRAEKYFNAVQATVNGQEVTLQDENGRVEAPMPNGEVIVLDTPSMEIVEDGFEFDENDALVSVTVNDRLGNTVKLTGDQALDFAIRDRENKIGVVEQAEFDKAYQEVETRYVKEAKPAEAPVVEEVVAEEAPVEEPAVEEVVAEAPVVEETPVAQADAKTKQLNALLNVEVATDFSEVNPNTKKTNKVLDQVTNAAKAISKVLPKVKFVIHATPEAFVKATKELDGRESEGGIYDHNTKTIHINLKNANNRTVAHEVFHALILSKVASDAEASRLTRSMVKAVIKSLKSAKGSAEIIAFLEDFESDYDANVQNEEKLAELFGILADNYKQLPLDTRNVIVRFLERIAKLFGLQPMTSAEVTEFMNVLSRKVEGGDVITFEEIGKQKEGEVSVTRKQKNEKRTEAPERTEAQARSKNDGGANQAVRENAKRENVKKSIEQLRDQGLLVTAQKGGGKMTNEEINAFMALSDAMAKVWKQTTGQDNFYDTFIDQVKQGDLNAIKEKGGVLFQNIEIPQRPISRVTLAVFELPEFKQMQGKEVSVDQVRNMIKSRGKQIEKDIINEVLSYDKYQEKKMMFDVFRNDVEIQLMKLEPITTATYATYGMDNLGKDQDYGRADTIIFNTPVDHGYTGHFGSDFSYGNLGSSTRWEIRQLPGVNQYVAIDADMPSGLVGDQIVEYVGTAGSKESVEKWVEKRKDILSDELNVGLFGHIRSWFNKGTGVFTLAEAQSDWFQKKKPADIFSSEITQEKKDEIEAKAKKAAEAEIEKLADYLVELNKASSERYGLSIELKKDSTFDNILVATVKDSDGDILKTSTRDITEQQLIRKRYNEQELITSTLIDAISEIRDSTSGRYNALLLNKAKEFKDINEQELKDIDTILDYNSETNYLSLTRKDQESVIRDLEREEFRWKEVMNEARNNKTFDEAYQKVVDLKNKIRLLNPNERMLILLSHGRKVIHQDVKFINDELNDSDYNLGNEISKQRKIAKDQAIEEIKNSKKGDLILQQFLASAKVHELRLMRESFKHAANKGAKELWFPTPYTLAVIEGYVDSNANGTGNAPYEIIDSRYDDQLQQGDTIRYEGDSHIVLDNDSSTITVADLDYVQTYDRDDFIYNEANDYYGDELRRDFENQFGDAIDRDDFESGAYKRNETYSYIVEREMQNWFNANPDEDVLFWDGISDDVISEIEKDLSSLSNEDLFGGYGNIYEGGYSTVYVVESNREFELLQPDQYEGSPTEEEGWEDNLADNQKTVVNKYKELNKVFEKLRPDTQLKVDDNGRTWLSTNITAEDLMNPVIAFQNEGAKVKGAVDFSNDNKASIYLFDGADISTLAHEVSGHIGRRMLEKLAETDAEFKKDYEAAMKWAGARDGEWSVASEEKFARGFERYLQTGKAPFEGLRNVFEKLRTWLTNIYKQIKGSSIDVKLTPEITRVFDNLLKPKAEQKFAPRKQKNSVDRLVKEGKEQGKTDQEIKDDAKAAGFTFREASTALSNYYAKEEGVFVRSGKTGVTTKLYEGAKRWKERNLKSKGLLPKIGFFLKEKMEGEISKETNRAVKIARKFGKMFDNYKGDKDLLLDAFDRFLRGDTTVSLPNNFASIANEMRNHIDTLSKMLINVGAVEAELADVIRGNIGSYLTRSYEIYDNKNWRNNVGKETITKAKNFLRSQESMLEMAVDKATQENITLDEALDILVDNKIDDLFAQTEPSSLVSGSRLGSKDLSTLKEREEIPEEIRMLMGEYSDPAMNYARTVNSIIHLAARHKFLTDMRKAGLGKFFYEKNDLSRPVGFNSLISAEGSEVMAPLNGLYTTPEIVEAFNQEFGQKEISDALKVLYTAMGFVKWLKTIASVGTHAKNIISNLGFVMVNGHNIVKIYNDGKIAWKDLNTMSDAQVQAKIDEYIEAGIMRQGAGINEIRDMFKDTNLDKYLERRLSNKKSKGLLGKIKGGLISFKNTAEAVYQAEDDMFKIAAYENELSRYANAYYNKKYENLTPQEKAEVSKIASENVKNTYPTYSRIPAGIKKLRRFPLFIGSFISFQAESYRTAYNTIALAKEELASDNKKIKMIGATRIAGATAYLTIKNALLTYYGMAFGTGISGVIGALFNDDEEEKKEKDVRQFLPPWSKNSDIIFIENADGTIKYIDFSSSDPHGGINKALNAFFRGEDLTESFTNSFLGVVEQFTGPDITLDLALQLKNNTDKFGNKIYNTQAPFDEQAKTIIDYVYKTIEPGTFTSVRKLVNEEDKGNVVFGELTGAKVRKVDVIQQFGFKLNDLKKELDDIKSPYNSEYYKAVRMMDDPKVSKKEFDEQARKTEQAYATASALYDAKTKEIMNLLNSANKLGADYDALMQELLSRKVISQYNLFEMEQGRPAIIEEKQY